MSCLRFPSFISCRKLTLRGFSFSSRTRGSVQCRVRPTISCDTICRICLSSIPRTDTPMKLVDCIARSTSISKTQNPDFWLGTSPPLPTSPSRPGPMFLVSTFFLPASASPASADQWVNRKKGSLAWRSTSFRMSKSGSSVWFSDQPCRGDTTRQKRSTWTRYPRTSKLSIPI